MGDLTEVSVVCELAEELKKQRDKEYRRFATVYCRSWRPEWLIKPYDQRDITRLLDLVISARRRYLAAKRRRDWSRVAEAQLALRDSIKRLGVTRHRYYEEEIGLLDQTTFPTVDFIYVELQALGLMHPKMSFHYGADEAVDGERPCLRLPLGDIELEDQVLSGLVLIVSPARGMLVLGRHPHVSSEHMVCFGNLETYARAAWSEGRLSDLVDVTIATLNTYNPDSVYWSFDDSRCACGSGLLSDETCGSDGCDRSVCADCSRACDPGTCDRVLCEHCGECCHVCNETFCNMCIDACVKCGYNTCRECLSSACSGCGHSVCSACVARTPDIATWLCIACADAARLALSSASSSSV